MNLKLFVGDCDEYLANEAKKYDSTAFLIDFGNYKKILKNNSKVKNTSIVAYTSAADLPKITSSNSAFFDILNIAEEIYYCPPLVWSDANTDRELHSMQKITEYFLYEINNRKNNVNGLDLTHWKEEYNFLQLEDYPKSKDSNIWIAGCSITEGVGVDTEQRYGNLLAKSLDKSLVMLGRAGTSNEFAADQILRSDIKSTDIVIWGVTSEFRATEWNKISNDVHSINPYNFEKSETGNLETLSLETRLYKSIISINQVINFCQKVGCSLYIFPIISSENLVLLLAQYEEFYMLPYKPDFIDKGTDNEHPGPKQHQWYADKMLKAIRKQNENF